MGALLWAPACDPNPTTFTEVVGLAFSAESLDLGFERSGRLEVTNVGDRPLEPVTLEPGTTTDAVGRPVVGVAWTVDPPTVASLPPGQSLTVDLRVDVAPSVEAGLYGTLLTATGGFGALAAVTVRFQVLDDRLADVVEVEVVDPPAIVRQGDVHRFQVRARTADGTVLDDPPAVWWVAPEGAGIMAGERFVGYDPGPVRVRVQVGRLADSVDVGVEPRGGRSTFSRLGGTPGTGRIGADLWIHGDHAYTGTWRGADVEDVPDGNAMFVWDVSNPLDIVLTDSLVVDARTASDVKIREDGTLGVLAQRGSSDGLNGITLFTLDDPAHPRVLGRYTRGLEAGVANVWLEGPLAYVAVGGPAGGLRVLDLSDPATPLEVGGFSSGESVLEDVTVRDGLAFLSYWDAGLVILDVGNGVRGGSPADPREVSRIRTDGGQTHNAWYWPDAAYVFVGEEDFTTPGRLHVVDVSDLEAPTEVAGFGVPGFPPHNFWLDEERGVLYAAWYEQGVRALDVSGELLGDLGRQGREIASVLALTGSRIWAPRLHRGVVFAADMATALQAARPLF